jgi:hypothetical protein
MLIRVASDLHLEAFYGRDMESLFVDFMPRDPRDDGAVLVLAGDISSDPNQLIGFLLAVEKRFKHVVYVGGNHEAYRHNFDAWNLEMRQRFDSHLTKTNAAVLNEVRQVVIDGTRFIFGTLWGDGGPTLDDRGKVGFYLNDFRLITRDGQRRFTVDDMMNEFKAQKVVLQSHLNQPHDGKTVVVTHHLPSRRLVSARFWPMDGSDGANGGFVGQCDDILAKTETAPSLWIHGHTHDTIDTELWKTRIVCNPAGYRGEWFSKVNTFMQVGKDGPRTVPFFVEL